MEVIIRETEQIASDMVAEILCEQVRKHHDTVLGLATGRTMERVYSRVAEIHKKENVDFLHTKTFNLDEYVGLSPENKNSYRYYMNELLFDQINIDLRNTYLPNGMANDFEVECKKYEETIKNVGGIDLQLLGIGESGHIGFNEPLSAFRSRTRVKPLTPTTVAQNSPLFDNPEDMPKRAISMGIGTILDAKRIVMLVTGEKKADVLAKAVEGPVTAMISATALQLHAKCVVIVDEAAATKLQGKDYYHWIFQNEPEWESFR
ncbi:MAG: glucosamine-6-phosphate deaminase [Verrucomicrobiota bacterium]|nr:glucosamine-6-phosphate deaminase [Verrucomicrobiota bacterium]